MTQIFHEIFAFIFLIILLHGKVETIPSCPSSEKQFWKFLYKIQCSRRCVFPIILFLALKAKDILNLRGCLTFEGYN